jgi:hypothetical protein
MGEHWQEAHKSTYEKKQVICAGGEPDQRDSSG